MKILIVDDEVVCRSKMMGLLLPYGKCDTAIDGTTALKLFEAAQKERKPYALITMDINMPDINGPEVVKKMRHLEQLLELPSSECAKVLMATTETGIKTVSRSYYEGCDGYLTKPATQEDVVEALMELGIVK